MDICARRELGAGSAWLAGRCWGLADTEGVAERPDSAWLSSSSSSSPSLSSSSGPSESSPSESCRSVLPVLPISPPEEILKKD